MNVLIAPDKFKGSLTAQQVCDAIADGIQSVNPKWLAIKSPLADGGDGTCEILTSTSGGNFVNVTVHDPLFRKIESGYGISSDGKTAFIEMAKASGLQLLKVSERNPRLTTSLGTGELIVDALNRGVTEIIIGCGGTATNDGGIGMASALGISFLDSDGKELRPVGDSLSRIQVVNTVQMSPGISNCKFTLLSDVDNPLTGRHGAAYTYARQKGANDNDIVLLDNGLKNFAEVLERGLPGTTNFKGAGAAGGFPVSARVFLSAEIKSGIEYVINFSGIEEKVKSADLIITGEGKFDNQSLDGKVVSGVARICREHNKPLWVICGVNEVSEDQWMKLGIEKVIPISAGVAIQESMKNASELIQEKVHSQISTSWQ